MFTRQYAQTKSRQHMESPLSLCDKLGLVPSPDQHKILARFEACARGLEHTRHPMFQRLDVLSGEGFVGDRAIALCALWRVLEQKGSSCVILAPKAYPATEFMEFLAKVIRQRGGEILYITDFPRWNVLKLGGVSGWEMRLVPNVPAFVTDEAARALISIELCAGDSSPEYVEACRALEDGSKNPKNILVRVW